MIYYRIKSVSTRSLKKTCWGWRLKLSHFKIKLTLLPALPIITTHAITLKRSMISNNQLSSQELRDRISKSTWPSRVQHGPNYSTKLSKKCWKKLTKSISRGVSLKYKILLFKSRRRKMRLQKFSPKSTRLWVRKPKKFRMKSWIY